MDGQCNITHGKQVFDELVESNTFLRCRGTASRSLSRWLGRSIDTRLTGRLPVLHGMLVRQKG
eukprot:12137897-Prorocentrum_lima.AAC.1